ncbi:sialate O-acetylesterase [Paradesertivirga mongoliensis]|uniref:Sialate O-acetylesterase n=1 Tax=Paradesertivirga mongoliensis TaxID=2100740 RepID=A0ABW4ZK79_9SPHI|nr:sialate O-acetylesterase [Pedobacter mongoliensis]
MERLFFSILSILISLSGFVHAQSNELKAAGIFSDNVVLQKGKPIVVWGTAVPGCKVTVVLNKISKNVMTNGEGKWKAILPALNYGGPFTLKIKSQDSLIAFKNVMVGEVWLASGQSNMNFQMKRPIKKLDSIAALANFPMIREFNMSRQTSNRPQTDIPKGQWRVCTPETVKDYSAVCYFFAKTLYTRKKIAIGIVNASWPGTRIESWMSKEALESLPDFKDLALNAFNDTTDWRQKQRNADRIDSLRQIAIQTAHNGLDQGVTRIDYVDTAWKMAKYPLKASELKAPYYSIIWFRKSITIPEQPNATGYTLRLGKILESNITYFNGVEIGRNRNLDMTEYKVPASLVKSGKNVITVRMVNGWGSGQLGSPRDSAYLKLNNSNTRLSLNGSWLYNDQIEQPLSWGTSYQNKPTGLFNAMINPILPFSIKGIIWYQGESNANDFAQYEVLQPLLIKDWRKRWQMGDIPFLFVQLPNLLGAKNWPWMREAQSRSLSLPITGMAVSIDLGDPYDIHPSDKEQVGVRLALLAESIAYHKKVTCNGPRFKEMHISGNQITIHFQDAKAGLLYKKNSSGSGFTIAGKDQIFYPAIAQLNTDGTIALSSDAVSNPLAVRYAWKDNPEVTIFNREGLPLAPFRTDRWVPNLNDKN